MDDHYRIRPDSGVGTRTPPQDHVGTAPRAGDWVTGLLWIALAVCIGGNAAVSVLRPDSPALSVAFGVPALVCIAVLVLRYLRRRQA